VKKSNHSVLVPIYFFLGLILIGALLLWTPCGNRVELSFLDALFTSTSATCVTGLVVVDTGTAFTYFGQTILIIQMELGALGIMTLSTLLLLIAGGKTSFQGQSLILQSFTQADGCYSPTLILKEIAKFSAIIQLIGFIIFFMKAPAGNDYEQAFFALFHTVSAFANAGFSTLSTGFIAYQGDWLFNMNAILLILSGGIGFITLSELFRLHKPDTRFSRISLHSKIALSTSAILILVGTLFFLLFDWHNSISQLPITDKILISLFHSVSSRTAGFNSVDFGAIAAPTAFLIILLMYIGGSPGSAAGGIKTTTAAVVASLGFNRFLGRERTQMFGKTIPSTIVESATRLFILGIVIVVVATLAITSIETWNSTAEQSYTIFIRAFFESVSAFATCGLSMNFTPTVTPASKTILIALMFIGRLGPLYLITAVSKKTEERAWFAEEQIMIG